MEGLLQRFLPVARSKWAFAISFHFCRDGSFASLAEAALFPFQGPIFSRIDLPKSCYMVEIQHMLRLQSEGEEDELNRNNGWEMLSLEEALASLDVGMPPMPFVKDLACILHNCRKERNLAHALRLHAQMRQSGLETHALLGNPLVSMMVDVGSMSHAQQVFDQLLFSNECSWNSLITGYVKHGESQHALSMYLKMQEHDSLHPSGYSFLALLKACIKLRDLEIGCQIHDHITRNGFLERDIFLGSTLIDMYAKCGSIAKAREVFEKLQVRDVVSWTALIAGYVEHGHGEEALNCFEQMQHDGISPDAVTFSCSLKACGIIGATVKGQELHAGITSLGLERDIVVSSTLVDMYVKCGSIAKAQEVFDKLPNRNVVLWNALITGYAEHGGGEEALNCLEQMQNEGISPDAVTFACSLKACGSIGATYNGQVIHMQIAKKGLERDLIVGNTLVDMYAKCGLLGKAQEVFDNLPVLTTVSWNALISGYVEGGCGEEALNCFKQMQHEGISPDVITFACSLKACGSVGAAYKVQEIHAAIIQKGLEKNLLAVNTLVDIYAKCGMLPEAQEVFDKLSLRDIVTWNVLISGYAEHGYAEEALNCLEQIQHEDAFRDAVTFSCSLKACGSIGATHKGQKIHTEISRKGFDRDLFVGSTLVDMYAKCGSLVEAQAVFDKLQVRTIVPWNALIGGYVEHDICEESLDCFEQMQHEGVCPDAVTYVCCLKACGSMGATDKGQAIHSRIVRKGLDRDVVVGSTLVDMYAKGGWLVEAQEVCNKLPVRTVFLWTALLTGYAELECGKEALGCLEQMEHEGISPDNVTFACGLKACGSIGATDKGLDIHAEIARKGLDGDLVIGSTLVDMYAKCGLLAEAQEVSDKLRVRTMVSLTALITGYVEHGHGEEALNCFGQMQQESVSADDVVLVCGLKACGSIGATEKGQEIFAEIAVKGLERDTFIGNTLVDMFAKCGLLAEAQVVFDKLLVRDEISWSALITGFAQLGESQNVFINFDRMLREGIKPNVVTFISVLNACSHAGLVDKGEMYFEALSKDYGIIPTFEHHSCMVDLLGRAGHLDKAFAIVEKMPFHPATVLWQTVLGACRKWGNVELGREAFELAVQLDEKDAAAYVCMFNIYADSDMQGEVMAMR